MIYDTDITLVFAESSVLSNAFVRILLTPEVWVLLLLSYLFYQPCAVLFDDVGCDANVNRIQHDLPMETIVSKWLRSHNETCAKLLFFTFVSVSSFSNIQF